MRAILGRILILVTVAFLLPGCAHTVPDNRADRPWNAPRNWEHGLPTGLMEGR